MTLQELIEEARQDEHALAECGKVWVEINGGVPIYGIGDEQCTAGEASEALDHE